MPWVNHRTARKRIQFDAWVATADAGSNRARSAVAVIGLMASSRVRPKLHRLHRRMARRFIYLLLPFRFIGRRSFVSLHFRAAVFLPAARSGGTSPVERSNHFDTIMTRGQRDQMTAISFVVILMHVPFRLRACVDATQAAKCTLA